MANRRTSRSDRVEVHSNLKMLMRERGKIVRGSRREVHNIWLNAGRLWLANLVAYSSYSPLTPQEDNRIRYIGVGIGGNKQDSSTVNDYPMGPTGAPLLVPNGYYPGTNTQDDTTPSATALERPVMVSSTNPSVPSTPPLYSDPGQLWMKEVGAPASHPTSYSTKFVVVFTETEISYGPFLTVPMSEIGLFTNAVDPAVYNNQPLAYDTFTTITKTSAFSFEVEWTLRF